MAIRKRDGAIDDFNRKVNRLEREYKTVKNENKEIKGYVGLLSIALFAILILATIVINLTGFSIFNIGDGVASNVVVVQVGEQNFSRLSVSSNAPYTGTANSNSCAGSPVCSLNGGEDACTTTWGGACTFNAGSPGSCGGTASSDCSIYGTSEHCTSMGCIPEGGSPASCGDSPVLDCSLILDGNICGANSAGCTSNQAFSSCAYNNFCDTWDSTDQGTCEANSNCVWSDPDCAPSVDCSIQGEGECTTTYDNICDATNAFSSCSNSGSCGSFSYASCPTSYGCAQVEEVPITCTGAGTSWTDCDSQLTASGQPTCDGYSWAGCGWVAGSANSCTGSPSCLGYNADLTTCEGGFRVGVCTFSQTLVPVNLTAYYSFDADNSTTAFDFSGNDYIGSYVGGVTNVNGFYGNATSFDGTNGYLNLGRQTALEGTSPSYTVSLWVKMNQAGTSKVLFSYDNNDVMSGDGSEIYCPWYDTGKIVWNAGSGGGEFDTGITDLGDSNWHYLTFVMNGTAQTIYEEGSYKSSTLAGGVSGGADYNLRFGNGENIPYWNGLIDDLMVFNHALTAGQISAIYNNQSARFVSSGSYTYSNVNFGTNDTANITLNSYQTNLGSQIGFQVNSGDIINFTNGVINNYPLSGDLSIATVKLYYYSDAYVFYSPIVSSNFTVDSWNSTYVASVDTTAPAVSIAFPTNTNYTTATLNLNYTASDETVLDKCWYSFDAGITMSAAQVCGTNWTGLATSEGENRWTVYVNDTTGNTNSTDVFFFVDSLAPSINFSGATSSGTVNGNQIYVNLTTSDTSELHYSFVDFDRSLSLWYRMDNVNATGDVIDSSLYSINGSVRSGAVQTANGRFGKGFDFSSGSGAYINVPVTNFNNPTTAITISAWANSNVLTNWGRIVGRDNFATANKYSWVMYQDTKNRTTFAISNGTIQKGQATANNAILNNTWYHFVGTYNGTAMFLYVNGVLSTTTTLDANTTNMVFSPITYLTIGSNNSLSSSSYLNGTVDEVIIFNRSLSASEIASLYSATASQYNNNFTDLSSGNHTITGYAVDAYGNKNSTETRTVTLTDTVAPSITISSPTSGAAYSGTSIELNYTATDGGTLNSCWYSLNGGANTSFVGGCGNNAAITASSGSNTVLVYANDSYNNVNYASLIFIVDLVNPTVNFTSPTSSGTINGNAIYVNLTTSDTNGHYSFVDFNNSLSGWWRGESNTNDESRNGNNGNWIGTANYARGEFGNAFSLDGSSYVNTSHIYNDSSFTASVWFKATTLVNGSNILDNGYYSSNSGQGNVSWQLRLGLSEGTKVFLCMGNSTNYNCLGNSSNHAGIQGYLSTNTWYHTVVTYDGSNGNTSFYINGIMNWSDSRANMVVSSTPLIIGRDPAVANTGFNGLIDDVILFNRKLTSAEVFALYNATANQYANNFTSLSVGSYNFTGYAVDVAGNKNQTDNRTVVVAVADTTAPNISVVSPLNMTYNSTNAIVVNFTSSDETAVSSRWFFNGTANVSYSDAVTLTLLDGQYTFIFYTNDSSNNVNSSSVTFAVSTANTGVPSCLAQCSEGSGCVITSDCHLDSSMCSGNICQFSNLTLSAKLKTGTDGSGNALNLAMNITSTASSPVLFLAGGAINFTGSAGSVGGNASIVNITVYNLFNTTNAFFYGMGGKSTSSAKGGNGGKLQINAHGIIRYFSDDADSGEVDPSNWPVLTGGSSNGGDEGTDNTIDGVIFSKDLVCTSIRLRDRDIDGDGHISSGDKAEIVLAYNDKLGEGLYTQTKDINCDNNLNVIELSRIGLQYNTR